MAFHHRCDRDVGKVFGTVSLDQSIGTQSGEAWESEWGLQQSHRWRAQCIRKLTSVAGNRCVGKCQANEGYWPAPVCAVRIDT